MTAPVSWWGWALGGMGTRGRLRVGPGDGRAKVGGRTCNWCASRGRAGKIASPGGGRLQAWCRDCGIRCIVVWNGRESKGKGSSLPSIMHPPRGSVPSPCSSVHRPGARRIRRRSPSARPRN